MSVDKEKIIIYFHEEMFNSQLYLLLPSTTTVFSNHLLAFWLSKLSIYSFFLKKKCK